MGIEIKEDQYDDIEFDRDENGELIIVINKEQPRNKEWHPTNPKRWKPSICGTCNNFDTEGPRCKKGLPRTEDRCDQFHPWTN